MNNNKLSKILEYLSYLFVFLLPWQTRWIFHEAIINGAVFEYGRMSLYAFDAVFIVLIVSYLVSRLKLRNCFFCLFNENQHTEICPNTGSVRLDSHLRGNDKKESRDNKKKTFLLLITNYKLLITVFVFLNIIFSQNKILTIYWWLRIGEALMLCKILKSLGFFRDFEKRIKMAWIFIFSVSVSAALGIYQFLTQNAFANKWLGIAYHGANELGASVVETADGMRFLRAYGSFPHPNILAGFILVALVLLMWLKNTNIKEKRKLFYFVTLLFITALFFTFSRTGWLIGGLMGLIELVRQIGKIRQTGGISKILKQGFFIFLCFYFFMFLCWLYWPLAQTRLGLTREPVRLETKSVSERVSGYNEAWKIIKSSPMVGVGLGNYTLALQKNNPGLPGFSYQPVHNVLVLAWAELGSFGILGILGVLGITRQRKKVFVFLCFFALLSLDHFWWTLPSGIVLMVGGLGFLGRLEQSN